MKKIILLLLTILFLWGCSQINFPSSLSSCKDSAAKMIPKYLVLSGWDGYESQIPNFWNDGADMSFKTKSDVLSSKRNHCLSKGYQEGENINYLYFRGDDAKCTAPFDYSQKIIGEDGVVLGDNKFSVVPIIKEADLGFKVDIKNDNFCSNFNQLSTWCFEGFSWVGFDNNVKEILGTDEVIVKFYDGPYEVVDILKFSDVSGNIEFGASLTSAGKFYFKWDDYPKGYDRIEIIPDIIKNKIYEIVDYKITDCEWVK